MRICPGCRATYEDHVSTCPRDNLPLIVQSSARGPTGGRTGRETVLAPGLMIGEYQIEGVVAEGTLGTIYSGIHPLIRKRVAIKVIKKHLAQDTSSVSRFVMEAYAVNEIGHHNIVDVFSIGELDDGRNYLIMELLEGLSLRQIIQRERRLKPGEILPVFEQLCDAMAVAHAKGYFHQDLKPENVFVLRRPPHPMIKVLDFGMARLKSPQVDLDAPTLVGTSAYVAPELFRSGEVDARVDIYAIGAILYELVTGRAPFSELDIERVAGTEPPRPSHFAAVGDQLERVILRAMAHDPADRFASASELQDDLRQSIPDLLPWTIRMELTGQQEPGQSIADTVARKVPIARPPAPIRPSSSGLAPETIAGEVPEDELETQHGSIKMRRWMKERGAQARDLPSTSEHADEPAFLPPPALPGDPGDQELQDLSRDTNPEGPPAHVQRSVRQEDDRTFSDIHPPTVVQDSQPVVEHEPPTATVRTEGPQVELPEEAEDQTISESKPEVVLDARQVLGAAVGRETDDDAPTATVRTGPAEMPAGEEAEDQTISESKPEVVLDARQVLGTAAGRETDDDAPTATVKTGPAEMPAGELAGEAVPMPEVVVDVHKLQGADEEAPTTVRGDGLEAEEAPTTVRGDGLDAVLGDHDLEGGYEEPDATKPYGPGGAAAFQQKEQTKPYGHKKRVPVDDGGATLEPEPAVGQRPGGTQSPPGMAEGPTEVADPLPSDEMPTTVAESSSSPVADVADPLPSDEMPTTVAESSPVAPEPPTRISDLRSRVAELVAPSRTPTIGTTSGMHEALEEALDSIDDLFEQVDGQPSEITFPEREVTKPERPSAKSVSPPPSMVGRVKLVKRAFQDNGPPTPPRTLMGIGPDEAEETPQEEEGEFDLELARTAPLPVVDWASAGEVQSSMDDEPYASIEIVADDDE